MKISTKLYKSKNTNIIPTKRVFYIELKKIQYKISIPYPTIKKLKSEKQKLKETGDRLKEAFNKLSDEEREELKQVFNKWD